VPILRRLSPVGWPPIRRCCVLRLHPPAADVEGDVVHEHEGRHEEGNDAPPASGERQGCELPEKPADAVLAHVPCDVGMKHEDHRADVTVQRAADGGLDLAADLAASGRVAAQRGEELNGDNADRDAQRNQKHAEQWQPAVRVRSEKIRRSAQHHQRQNDSPYSAGNHETSSWSC